MKSAGTTYNPRERRKLRQSSQTMLINREHSCLLVVDVQEKLLPGIQECEQFLKNCQWMIEVAQLLEIPVLATEQYPSGLGGTTETLRALLPEENIQGKVIFCAADSPECMALINGVDRDQIIIVGMEAHLCVMQTALRLTELGKQVFVVVDAISSRNPLDTDLAIARMREAGVSIVSREMVAFEWLRRSDSDLFKTFSKRFLQ